jgi:hypothetical protein
VPSSFIWAYIVSEDVDALVAARIRHTASRRSRKSSSPSSAARASMPSMNSSGMPRSVRVGTPSASRP